MISHKVWCSSFSCDGQCSDIRPEYVRYDKGNTHAIQALKKFFEYFNIDGITAEQCQEKEQNFNEFTDLAREALALVGLDSETIGIKKQ